MAERKARTLWTSIAGLVDWTAFFLFLPFRLAMWSAYWALGRAKAFLLAGESTEIASSYFPLFTAATAATVAIPSEKTRYGARTPSKLGTRTGSRPSRN